MSRDLIMPSEYGLPMRRCCRGVLCAIQFVDNLILCSLLPVCRINANVNEIVWMPDLLRPPVWVCGGNLCLPQLATSGLQYRESGSPIVQQISRYGDTPKYADMVDRDIGDIYRHMSSEDTVSYFRTVGVEPSPSPCKQTWAHTNVDIQQNVQWPAQHQTYGYLCYNLASTNF